MTRVLPSGVVTNSKVSKTIASKRSRISAVFGQAATWAKLGRVAVLRKQARTRGDLVAPAGVDGVAINAMLIAAVQQVVLSGSASGGFAGVALASDADWQRARDALLALIDGVYGPG